MDRKKPIIISDSSGDSDSDDCRIDETRSAPKPPISFDSRQPRVEETSLRSGLSQERQPRESIVWGSEYSTYPILRNAPSPVTRQNSQPLAYSSQLNPTVSKPQIVVKDYSDRHVEVRQIRRCTACTQDSLCCDGLRPCASCSEPGFSCVYPGEESVAPPQLLSAEETGRFEAIKANDSDEMINQEENDSLSPSNEWSAPQNAPSTDIEKATDDLETAVDATHLTLNSLANSDDAPSSEDIEMHDEESIGVQAVQDEIQNESDGQTGTDSSDDGSVVSTRSRESKAFEIERIPPTTWLPGSFEEVRKLIKTHQANIVSHREYLVEAQLASAKLKSKQNIHVDTAKKGVNPFNKMIAAGSDISLANPTSEPLNMRIKAKRSEWTKVNASVTVFGEDNAAHIPEYKSIGRLRSTFLARNAHGLKFVPYHPGIEEKDLADRRRELENGFKDHSSEEFRRQRECLELVYLWSDDFDEILNELHISVQQLWKWMSMTVLMKCQKCQTSCGNPPKLTTRSVDISKEEKQRCFWLYDAFMKITQVGIWHFVTSKPGQVEKHQNNSQKTDEPGVKKEQILCSLCFTHNCLTHGSYLDKEVTAGQAVINDAEEQINVRQKAALKVGDRVSPSHVCGLYCLGKSFDALDPLQSVIGIEKDGLALRGLYNDKVKMLVNLGPFRGTQVCSPACSLDKEERYYAIAHFHAHKSDVTQTVRNRVLSMAKIYSSHLRLPCMIAKLVRISCMDAFFLLMEEVDKEHQRTEVERTARAQEGLDTRKMSAKAAGYHTKNSSVLQARSTWIPCSHKGPCLSSLSDCACARDQVHCEKSCGCADNCRRRFKGCKCKKACFLENNCECFAANRECDPQLCHDCGVEEVLDPSNKYRDDIRQGRCRNNRIQLDLPPRTVKGISEVQGWGLFLGEDLPANSFVGEYKGENVSELESNRRGTLYAYVGQEYLFTLNQDNQLDGSRFGNKTRFINNSNTKEFINVAPRVMLVNGVTRVGLFTSRAIKAGEELLYNYGYPPEWVAKEFWEKYKKAVEHNGVVTPIARPKYKPREARNAAQRVQDDDESNHVRIDGQRPGKKKRKRQEEEEDTTDGSGGGAAAVDEEDTDGHMLATGGTDNSSEYEDEESSPEDGMSSHGSGVSEVDESEDELSIPTRRVGAGRKKKRDGRHGGSAQLRAAQTRRLNKERAQRIFRSQSGS